MRAKLVATTPGAEAFDGLAEAVPLPDASVDAAVCAQAFHWFDAPRALEELHRVLRPDAWLVLIWNVRDETVPWVKAMGDLVASLQENIPRHQDDAWRPAVDETPWFAFVETRSFRHGQRLSPDGVLDRLASMSVVAAETPEVRDALLAAVAGHPPDRPRHRRPGRDRPPVHDRAPLAPPAAGVWLEDDGVIAHGARTACHRASASRRRRAATFRYR